jgi:hypothetical protein
MSVIKAGRMKVLHSNQLCHKKKLHQFRRSFFVPGTGFEPAHPCERCDLNTVRLPISPPGHQLLQI